MSESLLRVQDLVISFDGKDDRLRVVNDVSFEVARGEVLAIVGESGSGKSVTALSILGLLPDQASVTSGSIVFEGRELLSMAERDLRRIRGREVAMIFQEPISALNPLVKIGPQITEAIRAHSKVNRVEAADQAIGLLKAVHVPAPERRVEEYPHQFSGGMAQRVAIAMALANHPKLLIADEPTTALDVTVQAQVLKTLRLAQQTTHASMILITHDMGLVAETADRVAVMYSGEVVESGEVGVVLSSPRHPYTQGLLRSLPRLEGNAQRLVPIKGQPRRAARLDGCAFYERCDRARGRDVCRTASPSLERQATGSWAACHFSGEGDGHAVD